MNSLRLEKKEILEYQKNRDPYLLIDVAEEVIPGVSSKGYKNLTKNDWFFKCHFKNDPVMPGCLGLDGFWQLIGFFLSWAGGRGRGRALGVKELKLKGQVRPYHNKITYLIDIRKLITKPTFMAWGDAVLKVDDKDKAIYFAKYIQVGLFEKLVWDSGMDPALDPF